MADSSQGILGGVASIVKRNSGQLVGAAYPDRRIKNPEAQGIK